MGAKPLPWLYQAALALHCASKGGRDPGSWWTGPRASLLPVARWGRWPAHVHALLPHPCCPLPRRVPLLLQDLRAGAGHPAGAGHAGRRRAEHAAAAHEQPADGQAVVRGAGTAQLRPAGAVGGGLVRDCHERGQRGGLPQHPHRHHLLGGRWAGAAAAPDSCDRAGVIVCVVGSAARLCLQASTSRVRAPAA